MSHNHTHHRSTRNLRLAFFLNLGFTLLEIVGGMYVNSVAILSDALHDLGDSLSLGIAWHLDKKSRKASTQKFSFGYQRFSVLGALINSVVLIAGSIFILTEVTERIMNPEETKAEGMLIFALVGILVNGYAVLKMRRGKTLNERVVAWHLLEDVLGWIAVLIVSIVLLFTDLYILDPILSALITLYVLFNILKKLRETFLIFLQGVPADINLTEIEKRLLAIDKIDSLHHVHTWTLDGENHVFTAHVKIEDVHTFREIVEIKKCIKSIIQKYPFSHYTIEIELNEEGCDLDDG
jgi:cobalt-zinc-cadmium efflux system protein